MNTTTLNSQQLEVGLGIFVQQGSSRPEWLRTGTPEQMTMPQTPHLTQKPTFEGPPPSFPYPADPIRVADDTSIASRGPRPASSKPWTDEPNMDPSQPQMRRGGHSELAGLGLTYLGDRTNAAFREMHSPAPSSTSGDSVQSSR
ncbi:hypothetical protein K439DRAFT_1004476 [Ramaria rubella]|nr:hypothetical protein K439DRAFT_1004476 [Ramaria rubella]